MRIPLLLLMLPLFAVGACSRELRPADFEKRAREITAGLTLEEKVGQVMHIAFPGPKPSPQILRAIAKIRPGGVILFGHNLKSAAQIKRLNDRLQSASIAASGIPLLISTDQEGGRVFRVPGDVAPRFPSAMALGQSGNEQLARDVGFLTGYYLREAGIDLVLAPVLDVNNNPANPVINTRSFGSDARLVGRMAGAHARGIREAGAIPVIKHFPGHGDTNTDSHLALPTIGRTEAELEKVELVPFRRAIADGAEVVMTAHILFPRLDGNKPATLSRRILHGILREKLKFRGVVMTDAMEMHAVAKRYPYETSVRMAMQAGVDVVLLTGLGDYVERMHQSLLKGYRSGELPMKQLDAAVARQIALKLQRGLFVRHAGSRPQPTPDERDWVRGQNQKYTERYIALRRRYAREGTSVSLAAAREGITSLRQDFQGLPTGTKVRVFAVSALTKRAALHAGVAAEQVQMGGVGAALRALRGTPEAGAWLVEFRLRDRRAWNRLVAKVPAGVILVGLYPDNPFFELRVPKNGALLASYTPTRESRRALVARALDGRPVAKARLVLPKQE